MVEETNNTTTKRGRPRGKIIKRRLQCYVSDETWRCIDGQAFARGTSRGEILDLWVRQNNKLK